MPMREQEPLVSIIRMRVTNPRAPRFGETGWIVDVLNEADTQQATQWIKLQFAPGERPIAYEYSELELCMP